MLRPSVILKKKKKSFNSIIGSLLFSSFQYDDNRSQITVDCVPKRSNINVETNETKNRMIITISIIGDQRIEMIRVQHNNEEVIIEELRCCRCCDCLRK